MLTVLLIDDDRALGHMLTELLSYEMMELTHAIAGRKGLELASTGQFDVVLLDVMLPELNGFALLEQLREHSEVPVIMLTAKGDPADRVRGLHAGADDYLPKPFTEAELIARIGSVTRRTKKRPINGPCDSNFRTLISSELTLDQLRQTVTIENRPVALTGTEMELLQEFLQYPGKVLSKDHLSRIALGRRQLPYDRSLDMHISQLRKKLAQHMKTVPIITRRGQGYLWAESVEKLF